jgi:hypothetical protein
MDFKETGWGCGLDSTGSRHGPMASCCECGDEPSGSYATELVNCIFHGLNCNLNNINVSLFPIFFLFNPFQSVRPSPRSCVKF